MVEVRPAWSLVSSCSVVAVVARSPSSSLITLPTSVSVMWEADSHSPSGTLDVSDGGSPGPVVSAEARASLTIRSRAWTSRPVTIPVHSPRWSELASAVKSVIRSW